MSASSARRGAAHRRSTSCRASGSVSAIAGRPFESDGATQRPSALRHAPSARSSSWSRFLANRSVAAGPYCPASRASAHTDSTVARRCLRPWPRRLSGTPRTARAANAAPRACSAPASPGTPTPDGPPGPPAADARPRAAVARTSPSGSRAGPCSRRCAARSPSCGPPAPSSIVAPAPEPRRVHERLREQPADGRAAPPSPRSAGAGCGPASATPGSPRPPPPAGPGTACCWRSGADDANCTDRAQRARRALERPPTATRPARSASVRATPRRERARGPRTAGSPGSGAPP